LFGHTYGVTLMQVNGKHFHKGENFDVSWIPNVDAIVSLITSHNMVFNMRGFKDVTQDATFLVLIMSNL